MDAGFSDHCRFLARYNRWINGRLYDACGALTDEERKRECGAFFGSLHRTLNHLVVADQVWLRRFAQCDQDHGVTLASLNATVLDLPPGSQLDTVLFEGWPALRAKREQLDLAIEAWLAEMPGGSASAPGLAGDDAFFQPPDAPPRAGHDLADPGGRRHRCDRPDCAGVTRAGVDQQQPAGPQMPAAVPVAASNGRLVPQPSKIP